MNEIYKKINNKWIKVIYVIDINLIFIIRIWLMRVNYR
jgi:hypothetical protein